MINQAREFHSENELKLSILLPVRNEGMNLKIMLKILRAVVEVPHEILVVHDDFEDGSLDILQAVQSDYPNMRVIHNNLGRGVINAIRTGVWAACGEYILIFAADEVGPVLSIDDMLKLMDQGCEFVSCTRYAHGGRRLGGSFIGGVFSRLANYLFHRITASVLTDSTTGIKMFRREIFESFKLESRPVGWVVAFEMAMKAQMAGLSIGEVPIVSIDRLYGGKSSFRLGTWSYEYLRWFLWGVKNLRFRPGMAQSKMCRARLLHVRDIQPEDQSRL